jgi:hypothetical protein
LQSGELGYIEGNFQGLLQLLDLGVRKWTGQKYPQQLVTPNYSWAEVCVQAAEVVEEFHQTVNHQVSECGAEFENIDLDFLTYLNKWPASCTPAIPKRLQNS